MGATALWRGAAHSCRLPQNEKSQVCGALSMFHAQTEVVLTIHVDVTHLRRVTQLMLTNNVDH